MQDLFHRAAVAALLACGVLIAGSHVEAASGLPLMQHRQFMLGLLGAGLVLSAFVPGLRAAAIGASALSELSFLAIWWSNPAAPGLAMHWSHALAVLLLVFSGAVFLREAWQQARWDGVLPLRPEA